MKPIVSIIIPVYNEEKVIADCLKSLDHQTYNPIEAIIVDDGSTDETIRIMKNYRLYHVNWQFFTQNHLGPGSARNLGAAKAKGKILVFVDADMTFDNSFLEDITKPILKGKTIGTFSKNEMVTNSQNIWSVCWNINRNLPKDRMIPENYPNTAPVFRAILKEKFDEVGGFDRTGEYTDDWSLSRKLGVKSTLAKGAIYYHSNPSNLKEVWQQARWIGKNQFISGNLSRKIKSLVKYSLPISIIIGIYKSVVKGQTLFAVFKIWYDFGIWTSTVKAFFNEPKSK